MSTPTALEQQIASTIERVYQTKQIDMPDGSKFEIKHHISPDEGKKLRDMVAQLKPQRTLEVGWPRGSAGYTFAGDWRGRGDRISKHRLKTVKTNPGDTLHQTRFRKTTSGKARA